MIEHARDFDIVGTGLEDETLNPPGYRKIARILPPEKQPPSMFLPFITGNSFGCWSDVYDAVGGMDPDFIANEDLDFSFRSQIAGYTLSVVQEQLVAYRFRSDARASWNQGIARGMSLSHLSVEYASRGFPKMNLKQSIVEVGRMLIWNPWLPNRVYDIRAEEWALLLGLHFGVLRGAIKFRS